MILFDFSTNIKSNTMNINSNLKLICRIFQEHKRPLFFREASFRKISIFIYLFLLAFIYFFL